MMVSYNPLKSFSAPFIGTSGESAIPLSQLPRAYLYPSASQGASMMIPFIYHRQWLDITSATDVRNMGNIVFTVLDSLKTASTSTSEITIQVYAWMEDIQLSGPTCGLSLQSGRADEYGKGVVSSAASAIAQAAGTLKSIPSIKPYATATQMIADTTSTIAKNFGFTNVPVVDDVHSLKPTPFPHMAATDIGTSIEKLAIDAKNELTIDPKVCGADFGDELLVSNIVGRESYYTSFTWTTAAAASDLLYNVRVTPSIVNTTAGTNQTILNGTPTWLVSRMFNNWVGDLEYRFKIICSQYHRGRLRFSWDPNGPIASTSETTTEVYTKIVDIAECTDVVIRVPYMQDTGYLYTAGQSVAECWATTPVSKVPFFDNGVLTVRVLTELSAPTTSADVTVLCFVRGCDNLEFANPKVIDIENRISPFTVQSGLLAYDNDDEDESSIALQPFRKPDFHEMIYMGEVVKSLRSLLRRAQYVRIAMRPTAVSSSDNKGMYRIWFNRYPPSPGYDPNGIDSANPLNGVLVQKYNYVPWNYITWLGQCFLGCRGAMMWYANTQSSIPLVETALSRSSRPPNQGVSYAASDYTPTYYTSSSQSAFNSVVCTQLNGASQGTSITNQRTCASNSAVIPFYSIYKFRQSYPGTAVLGTFVADSRFDFVQYNATVNPKVDATANAQSGTDFSVSFYCAGGTDFSFVFFLAVPTLFQYASFPTPV